MGRKGPRGATVERQVEIRQTSTWRFSAETLRERLSLPPDAVLTVGDTTIDDAGDGEPFLVATVVETRRSGDVAEAIEPEPR